MRWIVRFFDLKWSTFFFERIQWDERVVVCFRKNQTYSSKKNLHVVSFQAPIVAVNEVPVNECNIFYIFLKFRKFGLIWGSHKMCLYLSNGDNFGANWKLRFSAFERHQSRIQTITINPFHDDFEIQIHLHVIYRH